MIEEAVDDNVAALDQTDRGRHVEPGHGPDDVRDPRAGGIDEGACRHGEAASGPPVLERELPAVAASPRGDAARPRPDRAAAGGGFAGGEHDQARIVDPAVGILEAAAEARLQRVACRIGGEIEHARRRKQPPAAEMVVEEKAEADEPPRPEAGMVRQDEAERPDDVRRSAEKHLALDQRLAHQPELVELEIAEAAVDELGRGRRGRAGKVALLGKKDRQAAARGVAGDAAAVNAPADDGEVDGKVDHGRRTRSETVIFLLCFETE